MEDNSQIAPETEATEEVVVEDAATQAVDVEEQDAPQSELEPQEEPRQKSRHQRRREARDRLLEENRNLQTKVEEANARLAALEVEQGAMAKPAEADFTTFEEYQAAMSGWHAMQQLDSRNKATIEREAQEHQEKIQRNTEAQKRELANNWQTQAAEAKERYTDFEKVAYTAPLSAEVSEMIAGMDAGADVAYQLGLDHEAARQISSMPPLEAAMALGRIEAGLSVPKPKKSTNAPEPITPVTPTAGTETYSENMSPAQYEKWRQSGGTF